MADEEETLVMSLAEGFRRLGKEGRPSAELCRTPLIGVPSMGETQFEDTVDDTSVTNELPRKLELSCSQDEHSGEREGSGDPRKQPLDVRSNRGKKPRSSVSVVRTPVSTTQKILRSSSLSLVQWRLWLSALVGGALVGLVAATTLRATGSGSKSSSDQDEIATEEEEKPGVPLEKPGERLKIEPIVERPNEKKIVGGLRPGQLPNRGATTEALSEPPPRTSSPGGAPRTSLPEESPSSDLERRALELLVSGEHSQASQLYERLEKQGSDEQRARIWRHFSKGAAQLEKSDPEELTSTPEGRP